LDGDFSTKPHEHTGETDHLAAAVLRSLGRSFQNQFSIPAGKAIGLGLVTFGLWPIWQLNRQFRDYVTFERQQLWHLAEWLRVRRGGEDSLSLHDSLKQMRLNAGLKVLAWMGVAAFVLVAFLLLNENFSVKALLEATFFRNRAPWLHREVWAAWVGGLSLAYVSHAAQVALHHHRLEAFLERFNRVAVREGVAPLESPRLHTGLHPRWLPAAALAIWGGIIWAVPMVLAAGMQRAYINETATRFRAGLLDRAREMIQQQRPAVAVPSYVIHGKRCENPRCKATLKAGARYCSRCGASAGLISEVA
jgi:hypothetical protein